MKKQQRLPFKAPLVGERFCLVGVVTRRNVTPWVYRVATDGQWEIVGRCEQPNAKHGESNATVSAGPRDRQPGS
jgi:hypothetical protein